MLDDSLDSRRQRFAQQIAARHGIVDQRLIDAFAAVPRERYLGPGPWHVLGDNADYAVTSDDDPALVYVDAAIALDSKRNINNGEPGLHIGFLAQLAPQAGDHIVQVGVGGGYYTAILARLVRPGGRVTAIEYDVELAQRASKNLAGDPDIAVIRADGTCYDFDPADGIYVNAGATRASDIWLDKLKAGGRLVMMLTTEKWWGQILKIAHTDGRYAATLLGPCGFIPCINARDPVSEVALSAALAAGGMEEVRSLRRESHSVDKSCWMHCEDFCLSRLRPQ